MMFHLLGIFRRKAARPVPQASGRGAVVITYTGDGGPADSHGYNGAGGNGGAGGGGWAMIIDSSKEQKTREIVRAMEGSQPTDFEWDAFFMRGTEGGGMSSEIYEKMKMAHNIAKNLKLARD